MAEENLETVENQPRYLDAYDNEISVDDCDLEKGSLKYEQLFVKHHDAIEAKSEIVHYKVSKFYFEDGTELEVSGNDDPHVKVIDEKEGIFQYVDCGEGKIYFGADLDSVVDEEQVDPKEAWDEYETIYRYTPYTDEELAEKKAAQEAMQKHQDFIENGPDKLDSTASSVEDITVMLSEMIGVSE